MEIEYVLNKEFANVRDSCVDNKLSMHFGEDKTKCILFSRDKNLPELNTTYNNNRIKQQHMVIYLGCCLDANSSRESMIMKSIRKINTKLQFLYTQNGFLNPKLRMLLCNPLIQPHFDYACISWFPLINQKMRNKLQITQNKCIHFSLKLTSRQHIRAKEFKKINWLSTKERVEQHIATKVFNYWKGTSPLYVNELFVSSRHMYHTRSHMALEIPLK